MRIFSKIRELVTGLKRVHLLHIGKTGGTALKHALRNPACTSRYRLVFHPHQTTIRDIPCGEKIVFSVRDPISRFVSAFLSRRRRGLPRYHYPWSCQEQVAFETFASPDALAIALNSTNASLRAKAVEAMRSINHLKSSYRRWLGCGEELLSRKDDILLILFQETLNADFDVLRELLNLNEAAALPSDKSAAHRNPSMYDRELSPQAVKNLATWYAEDFELLQICRDLRKHQDQRASEKSDHQ